MDESLQYPLYIPTHGKPRRTRSLSLGSTPCSSITLLPRWLSAGATRPASSRVPARRPDRTNSLRNPPQWVGARRASTSQNTCASLVKQTLHTAAPFSTRSTGVDDTRSAAAL